MALYPQSVIDALRTQSEQLNQFVGARVIRRRASLEESVRDFDEKWALVERKNEKAVRESPSEAWTNSLRSLHAERKCKNDKGRTQLLGQLEGAAVGPVIKVLDTDGLKTMLSSVDDAISKYSETLSVRRRQTQFPGEYGQVENEKWIKEVVRFIDRNPEVSTALEALSRITVQSGLTIDWRTVVAQRIDELIEPATVLPDVASSDGGSLEHACLLALQDAGWSATLTPATGDQGVDILAKKNEISVAIQCKNYRAPVGNGAVQEVHAGKSFYEADVAAVVSPSGYTPSATQLAKKLRVLLLDHTAIHRLEDLL